MANLIQHIMESLNEDGSAGFQYLDGGDETLNGNCETSPEGKVDGRDDAIPLTTQKCADQLTVEPYFARAARGLGVTTGAITENDDSDGDGVKDSYEVDGLDTLNNGNPDDNLTRIPNTVETRLNQLISDMKSLRLTPRQSAMVISKLMTACNIHGLDPRRAKTLRQGTALKNLDPRRRKNLKLQVNAQTRKTGK